MGNLKHGPIYTIMIATIGGLVNANGAYIGGESYIHLDLKVDRIGDPGHHEKAHFHARLEAIRAARRLGNARVNAAIDAKFPDNLDCVDGDIPYHEAHDVLVLQGAFCTKKALATGTSWGINMPESYPRPGWHGFYSGFEVHYENEWNKRFSKMIFVAEPCLLLKLEALL